MTMILKWYGDKAAAAEKKGAATGLYLGAEHVLEESTRLVPLLEGTLERSGVASVDAGGLRAAVSYDTVYAVIQHEAMDFNHPRGRQAKYLEQPLNSERGKVLEVIAREIKSSLGA